MSEEKTTEKIKDSKPPISIKAAVWILIVLLILGALSWGYSFATNVDSYAGTATSYTQWLTMNPIANGGCTGENAKAGSPEAIENAISYEYIVKLPVKLIDGKAMVASDNPYELKEALDKINGQTGVIADIKTENGNGNELASAIYGVIKEYKGNFAVESSDLDALKWFKDNAPNVIRGLATGELDDTDLSGFEKLMHRNMLLNFKVLPYYIACDYESLPNMIISDINRDAYVIATGITDAETARLATEYSDNVCIDGFSLY